jgi:hypothetical protein
VLDVFEVGNSVKDSASHILNEPELCIIFTYALKLSYGVSARSAGRNTFSFTAEDYVEVHTENTGGSIVLNSEIDMLINTKSEVTYIIN